MKELLKRLSEVAPEFCRLEKGDLVYCIAGRFYWINSKGEMRIEMGIGNPEMWLQAALQEELKRRGWDYEHRFFAPMGNIGPRHKVVIMHGRCGGEVRDTAAEALGWAFVKALEAK